MKNVLISLEVSCLNMLEDFVNMVSAMSINSGLRKPLGIKKLITMV